MAYKNAVILDEILCLIALGYIIHLQQIVCKKKRGGVPSKGKKYNISWF